MKKIFLFLILALYGYSGMGYSIYNRIDKTIKVVIWGKRGRKIYKHKTIRIRSGNKRKFEFKLNMFNHVDIKVRESWYSLKINKTIAQPDKKFFEKSDSKTISVSKDSKGGYKVQPE